MKPNDRRCDLKLLVPFTKDVYLKSVFANLKPDDRRCDLRVDRRALLLGTLRVELTPAVAVVRLSYNDNNKLDRVYKILFEITLSWLFSYFFGCYLFAAELALVGYSSFAEALGLISLFQFKQKCPKEAESHQVHPAG